MKKTVTFQISPDVYEKFNIAANLTKEDKNIVMENCLKQYIAKTFQDVAQIYDVEAPKQGSKEKDFFGKANQRISIWAIKPEQYNHKIIRAYFKSIDISGSATIRNMERFCSDPNDHTLFVPTFKSNYAQMKLDGAKTNGKVFEDDGANVWIWSEVEDILMNHKHDFYKG